MKQFRNITLGFAAIMMVFALYPAQKTLAGKRAEKRITIKANSSETLKITTKDDSVVKINAKADHGRVHIMVMNSDGKVIKEGYNKVKFKTKIGGKELVVVFTNETAKFQKAIVYGSGWDEGVAA